MEINSNNKIAILVISCDKYSDLWESCAKVFNKNWPECPYDKYLASNLKEFNNHGFTSILTGEDKTWSIGLKIALTILEKKYQYVFTLVEDYFFIEKLNNIYMTKMFDSFVLAEGNFLRLFKVLRPQIRFHNDYFGVLLNNAPYRQTIAFALWRINTLKEILKDDENAWEFEKKGVIRGFTFDKFFCVYKNPFRVLNVVIQGKLVPKNYKILQKILPEVNLSRDSMSNIEIILMNFRSFFIITFLIYFPEKISSKIYFYNKTAK